MTPANGIHFSLRESFLYLTKHDITRAEYFKVGTLPEHNPTHPRILCSQTTFYRRYSNYLTTQILPHIDDFGLQVGPRQICSDPCLPQLNFDINNTVGYSERTSSLAENLQQLKANENIERGAHRHVKQPSVSTTKLYQLLSCKDDPKIHLVKEKSLKKKIIGVKWHLHQYETLPVMLLQYRMQILNLLKMHGNSLKV